MMSQRIFQYDQASLDTSKMSEHTHGVFGPVTVFHDVVIAREIIHKYEDGWAYKPADELEAAYWTATDRWAIAGGHPNSAIIMDRDQIHGRTVNVRFTKGLIDPKTKRPNNRGIVADLEVFNDKIPSETLSAMKNGEKRDVSIGFFFSMDATAGKIDEDGHPLNGTAYDYIQRKISIDHTAFALEAGRCPMPFCGVGADEITELVAGDPFARWKSMTECIEDIMEENPDYTEEQAAATCAMIEKRSKAKRDMFKTVLENMKSEIDSVLSQFKDMEETTPDDGEGLKKDETHNLDEMSLGNISEETLSAVKEHYRLSDKSWDNLLDTEQLYLISRFQDKAPNVISDSEEQTGGDDECEDCDENEQDDYEEFIVPHLAEDAVLSYAQKKALPDSAYAYIEPGCEKEDGKTVQRCRHMPIHDPAHVRAALAALKGARTGKVPTYASKAKPKVCAAARKFKIESEVCGTKETDELLLDEYIARKSPFDESIIIKRVP